MSIKQTSVLIGIFSIISGIFIIIFSFNPSQISKYVLIASIVGIGIFALLTARKGKGSVVALTDYSLIGLGSLTYALALAIFASGLQQFLTLTAGFILLFGLAQIIFTFQGLDYKEKSNITVSLIKAATGLIACIASILVLSTSMFNPELSLRLLGGINILIGISFIAVTKFFVIEIDEVGSES